MTPWPELGKLLDSGQGPLPFAKDPAKHLEVAIAFPAFPAFPEARVPPRSLIPTWDISKWISPSPFLPQEATSGAEAGHSAQDQMIRAL